MYISQGYWEGEENLGFKVEVKWEDYEKWMHGESEEKIGESQKALK